MTDTNQKQLGKTLWNIADQLRGAMNADDIPQFEKQMRRKTHYVIQLPHFWNSIANMARDREFVKLPARIKPF